MVEFQLENLRIDLLGNGADGDGVYYFESLVVLIAKLFLSYDRVREEWQEVELVLQHLGYTSLSEVDAKNMDKASEWIAAELSRFELEHDAEYMLYRLLSAIERKEVWVYLNNGIITNIHDSISIPKDGIISFIDATRFNQMTFQPL